MEEMRKEGRLERMSVEISTRDGGRKLLGMSGFPNRVPWNNNRIICDHSRGLYGGAFVNLHDAHKTQTTRV